MRIAAPQEFRKQYLEHKDSPRAVVTELASLHTAGRTSALSRGQWSDQRVHGKKLLTAFLKLPTNHAKALLAKSGEKGIFLSIHESVPCRKNTTWVEQTTDESSESYHQRCMSIAKGRKQVLFCRKTNTKPSLGFEASAAEAAKAKTSAFSGKGVPQHWQHEELFSGCRSVAGLAR